MKNTTTSNLTALMVGASLVVALILVSIPAFASAASYAYVDSFGDVKMVIANDWQTAISIAPNRHINSGVLLLNSASDFTIIGDSVNGY